MNEEQFAKWLSGFIDAEGNFQVFFSIEGIYEFYLE